MFLVFLVNFSKKLSLCLVPKKRSNLGSKRLQTRAMPQVFESHGALRQAGGAEGDGRLRPSDAPWARNFWVQKGDGPGRGVSHV